MAEPTGGWSSPGPGPGIMAAGMEGAGRERSLGVNIRLPHEQGANAFIAQDPKLVEMRYFFTRKLMLIKESDGYAVLPGGFGTLDEAFELLTLLQTGKAEPAPWSCSTSPGGTYWQGWQDFVDDEVASVGLVSPEDRALYMVTVRRGRGRRRAPRLLPQLPLVPMGRRPARHPSAASLPPEPSWQSSPSASPTSWRAGPSARPSRCRPERSEQRPPRAAPGGAAIRPDPLRATAPAHRRPQRAGGLTLGLCAAATGRSPRRAPGTCAATPPPSRPPAVPG